MVGTRTLLSSFLLFGLLNILGVVAELAGFAVGAFPFVPHLVAHFLTTSGLLSRLDLHDDRLLGPLLLALFSLGGLLGILVLVGRPEVVDRRQSFTVGSKALELAAQLVRFLPRLRTPHLFALVGPLIAPPVLLDVVPGGSVNFRQVSQVERARILPDAQGF